MDNIINQVLFKQQKPNAGYKIFYGDEQEQVQGNAEQQTEEGQQLTAPKVPNFTAPKAAAAAPTAAATGKAGAAAPTDTVTKGTPAATGQPSGSLMKDVGEILISKNKAGVKIEDLAKELQAKGYKIDSVQGGKGGTISVTGPDGKTQVLKDTDGNGSIGMEDKEIAAAMQNSGIDPGKLAKLNQLGEEYKANLKKNK
jgi:hypothetical protein